MEHQAKPDQSYVWRVLDLFTRYGEAEAIVADGRRLSYLDVRAGVRDMAGALLAQGISRGGAIGLLATNRPEALFLQLGAHLLGCRTAWIAPDTPERHQREFLRLAEVDAVVHDPSGRQHPWDRIAHPPAGLQTLCLGPGCDGPDLLAPNAVAPLDPALPTGEPQTIFQTGGTTGQPKLVHHRHRTYQTILALTDAYVATGELGLRHLAASCLWHVSGHLATMMTLFTGGTWFPRQGLENEDIEDFLQTIEAERITSIFLTPAQLYRVLDHPWLAKTDTSSLGLLSVGGAPAAPSRLAQAVERFGAAVRPTYGSTEAPFITAFPRLGTEPGHAQRMSSCGLPYGDMRVEVRDDRGGTLPPGTVGEVWVTGGLTMDGYWGDPALTKETLVDGWVRTGDLGWLDAEGYLFLVDRVKDLIITGTTASKVYSRPIEDRLAAHPQVRAAAVIGVPDEAYGSAVHAYVVRAPDGDVTPEALRAWVVDDLNEEWSPREIDFVDALPLTHVGKVDKKELRARYSARTRE